MSKFMISHYGCWYGVHSSMRTVRVSNKGNMRTYKNARGEECVFNVEFTDEDGTQIQATMFNKAAKKFLDKFQLWKVYYISKGSLKVANKQFKTVQNDYEMNLNENSVVEEADDEASFVPEIKYNFVPIDELGPYVNGRELIDIIGVVQHVSPTVSIRRKIDNEMIPKRDITVADETKKTVVVSLWNDLATNSSQEMMKSRNEECSLRYIVSLKVSDASGEAWIFVFNDQAEKIIGCSADDLDKLKSQEGESAFQMKLKEVTWVLHLFRISVMPHEYNGEKRQRITARVVEPIDYAAQAKYMLEGLLKAKVSQ